MAWLQRWKLNRELKRIQKYCTRKGIPEIDCEALKQVHIRQKSPSMERSLHLMGESLLASSKLEDTVREQSSEIQAFVQLKEPVYQARMQELYYSQIRHLF